MKKINKNLIFQFICILYILWMVIISLKMNLVNRSLWLDEAMLSLSFFERNLLNLTSSSFTWNQSAPIIWLYIVKIITLIFGRTEFWLRFFSFISYILTLYLSWYLLAKVLKSRFSLLGTCLIASLFYLLQYSNEFKPYITDCVTTLLLIVVYFLQSQKKCSRITLNSVYILSIWLSNPACFVIAALLIVEFVIDSKERRNLYPVIISGSMVFISFIIYYFYWLKPVIDFGFMTEYWKNNDFSLSPAKLKNTWNISFQFFKGFRSMSYLFIFVFVVGFFANIFKYKNIIITIIYLSIIISLIASSLGMNPIDPRLYLWCYPLISILFIYFVSQLAANKIMFCVSSLLILTAIIGSNRIDFFNRIKNSYRNNQEFNLAYDYLKENITERDSVYMFHYAYPVFMYKSNSDITSIPPFKNNVIVGDSIFANGVNQKDINRLKKMDNLYILLVHAKGDDINPLLDSLKIYGSLDTVFYQYDTPVIKYQANKIDIKDQINSIEHKNLQHEN